MLRVIPQTREEKIAMYMKLTKRELVGMLVTSNEALAHMPRHADWVSLPASTTAPSPFRGETNVAVQRI